MHLTLPQFLQLFDLFNSGQDPLPVPKSSYRDLYYLALGTERAGRKLFVNIVEGNLIGAAIETPDVIYIRGLEPAHASAT